MKFIRFIVAFTVGTALAQLSLCGVAVATSSELTDAFSRLDALAEELAERQRALGGVPEAASDLTPIPPPEAVPAVPPVDTVATEDLAREPTPLPVDAQGNPVCGSRQEMAERMSRLQGPLRCEWYGPYRCERQSAGISVGCPSRRGYMRATPRGRRRLGAGAGSSH